MNKLLLNRRNNKQAVLDIYPDAFIIKNDNGKYSVCAQDINNPLDIFPIYESIAAKAWLEVRKFLSIE